jgi:hypothetical protein
VPRESKLKFEKAGLPRQGPHLPAFQEWQLEPLFSILAPSPQPCCLQVTQRAFDRVGSRLLVDHSTWGAAPPRQPGIEFSNAIANAIGRDPIAAGVQLSY